MAAFDDDYDPSVDWAKTLTMEAKKEQNKKSRQARLGPLYHHSSVLTAKAFGASKLSKPEDIYLANNLLSKQIAGAERYGMVISTSDTFALACKGPDNWYAKNGCCASIKDFDALSGYGDIFYYIPNVAPLSKGKKIAYVAEVSKFLGHPIEYVETQLTADGLSFPGSDRLHKPEINGGPTGTYTRPQVWVNVKEWLVFKTRTSRRGQALFVLQFLRSLYTSIATVTTTSSSSGLSLFMNQPQMYFRMKRMFPTLGIANWMMLSYLIHGGENNSTFFPYVWMLYPDRSALRDFSRFDTGENNSIINHVADVSRHTTTYWRYESPTKGMVRGVSAHTSNTDGRRLIANNLMAGTRAGYKLAVENLAKITGREALLKLIEAE